jgi:hypothetical protein
MEFACSTLRWRLCWEASGSDQSHRSANTPATSLFSDACSNRPSTPVGRRHSALRVLHANSPGSRRFIARWKAALSAAGESPQVPPQRQICATVRLVRKGTYRSRRPMIAVRQLQRIALSTAKPARRVGRPSPHRGRPPAAFNAAGGFNCHSLMCLSLLSLEDTPRLANRKKHNYTFRSDRRMRRL